MKKTIVKIIVNRDTCIESDAARYTMTVQDLIDRLREMPRDAPVVTVQDDFMGYLGSLERTSVKACIME